jgi:hypothetical protein
MEERRKRRRKCSRQGTEERRKRGRDHSRNEGWKRGGREDGSTSEKRNIRKEKGEEEQ